MVYHDQTLKISANAANICTRELDEYRGLDHFLVGTPSQRDAIFELRYDSYFGEGLISENAEKRFWDSQDDDKRSLIYGITLNGRLVSTIRLGIIDRFQKTSATYTLFRNVFDPLIERGETIADVSRLAVRCDNIVDRKNVLLYTLKTADIFVSASRANRFAIMARHSHWPFYKRYGFDLVSGPFSYDEALAPLSLMIMKIEEPGESFTQSVPKSMPINSGSEYMLGARG